MWEAERPLVYAGGGIIAANASNELRELVELLDVPTVCTLMGLGGLPSSHPNFISMPGMHGSYAANMGMTNADLLIALGVRFDDRHSVSLARGFAVLRSDGARRLDPRAWRRARGRRCSRS